MPADRAEPGLLYEFHEGSGHRLLFIEPYLNASHKALVQGLMRHVPGRWALLALSGRNFRWRMRGAAAFLAQAGGEILTQSWDGLFCSSMLNLAELRGLVPALAQVPALVYFHENQLAYPAQGQAGQRQQMRDLFLAWTNLSSALCAQAVVFNSDYQHNEFIKAGRELLKDLPDCQPPGLMEAVEAKSRVLPIPLDASEAQGMRREPSHGPLRILWNHRWSQDKDPEGFFQALEQIAGQGLEFELAVLGLRPGKWPRVFDQAKERLGAKLAHFGPVEDRRQYWRWLFWADVAVSTALQEYQGLALAEAVWAGCRPLAPHDLVYPDLYPGEFLYAKGELAPALAALARNPGQARAGDFHKLVQGRDWPALKRDWAKAVEEMVGA